MVFEVLSPRYVAVDRVIKLREYLAVPSIHTYVIAEQDRMHLTVYRRRDNAWDESENRAGGVLHLSAPAADLTMVEIYEDVIF